MPVSFLTVSAISCNASCRIKFTSSLKNISLGAVVVLNSKSLLLTSTLSMICVIMRSTKTSNLVRSVSSIDFRLLLVEIVQLTIAITSEEPDSIESLTSVSHSDSYKNLSRDKKSKKLTCFCHCLDFKICCRLFLDNFSFTYTVDLPFAAVRLCYPNDSEQQILAAACKHDFLEALRMAAFSVLKSSPRASIAQCIGKDDVALTKGISSYKISFDGFQFVARNLQQLQKY